MLVEQAIAEQAGEVEFYLNEIENIRSTIMPDHAELAAALGRPPAKTVVPSITFPTLIEKFGVPYFMKVDIKKERTCFALKVSLPLTSSSFPFRQNIRCH